MDELRKIKEESQFLSKKIKSQKEEFKQYFDEYDQYEDELIQI
jgi:hypothetical protein